MTWFRQLTLQNKLYLAFGVFIFLLIFLSVFSNWQFYATDKKYNKLITSTYGQRKNLSRARTDTSKLYLTNLSKGFHATIGSNSHVMAVLADEHEHYVESITGHLHTYRDQVSTDMILNKDEKSHLLTRLNSIERLLVDEYLPKTNELDNLLYGDQQKLYRVLAETLEIGNRIAIELDTLYGMTARIADDRLLETTLHSQRVIISSLLIGLFLFLFAIGAAVVSSRAIKAPITKIANTVLEIVHGNLQDQIKQNSRDELETIAHQISSMMCSINEMNKVMTIMDNLDGLISVVDLDYNFVYVNNRFAKMGKLDMQNYRGKKCYEILRNLDQPCSFCRMPDLLPQKDCYPSKSYEFVYDEAFGVWTGGKVSIIDWVDGTKVFMQSIRDETELKESQERLREAIDLAKAANEAKGQFLANMSHEIRTPMNAVLGMTELLLHEDLSKRQRRYVEDMKTSAVALLTIINDILDVSKIQAGKLVLVPVHYDFNMLIDNIGSVIHFLVENKKKEGKHISFRLVMPENPHLCLFGDDVRLRQVLLNLLGNAVKFTDKGNVQLRIDYTDTTIKMTVSDTGIGILPEHIPTIFDAFEQADNQQRRNTLGTGLGLTITQSIIKMMGGNITLASVYGQGTSFFVEIPLVLGDASLIHHSGIKASLVYAPGAKVLAVDDNEANLNVASGLLRLCHIQTDTVTSGRRAIDMIQQTPYDIVFMDHRMPDMSGIETTKAIRKLGISIPIIALTASIDTDTKEMMLSAGMDDYLSKPIIKANLMNVLRKWLPAEKISDAPSQKVVVAGGKDDMDKELWTKIGQIHGLDLVAGLDRVEDQRDVYAKSLRLVVREIEKSNTNLVAFLSTGAMENFCIEIHGIKGVLANVGAMGLAEKAYALEKASDKRNGDFCSSNLPEFLEELNALQVSLNDAFSVISQDADRVIMPSELPGILKNLSGAFDTMDLVLINNEIENLNAMKLKGKLKEEIEQIEDAVLMMDYAKATEYITQLLEKS